MAASHPRQRYFRVEWWMGGGEAKEVTRSRRQADRWVQCVGLRVVIGGVFCVAIVRWVTRIYGRGILLLQITQNFSNRSPCSMNGQWSADNDSELRSQSAMRAATRAAIVRGVTRSYWRGILLLQITPNFSNRSPCSRNGQWSADNDSELRSQSAMRASRAATRGYCPWCYAKLLAGYFIATNNSKLF